GERPAQLLHFRLRRFQFACGQRLGAGGGEVGLRLAKHQFAAYRFTLPIVVETEGPARPIRLPHHCEGQQQGENADLDAYGAREEQETVSERWSLPRCGGGSAGMREVRQAAAEVLRSTRSR